MIALRRRLAAVAVRSGSRPQGPAASAPRDEGSGGSAESVAVVPGRAPRRGIGRAVVYGLRRRSDRRDDLSGARAASEAGRCPNRAAPSRHRRRMHSKTLTQQFARGCLRHSTPTTARAAVAGRARLDGCAPGSSGTDGLRGPVRPTPASWLRLVDAPPPSAHGSIATVAESGSTWDAASAARPPRSRDAGI